MIKVVRSSEPKIPRSVYLFNHTDSALISLLTKRNLKFIFIYIPYLICESLSQSSSYITVSSQWGQLSSWSLRGGCPSQIPSLWFSTSAPLQPHKSGSSLSLPPLLPVPDYFSITLKAWPLDTRACFASTSISGLGLQLGGQEWQGGKALNQSGHYATQGEAHWGNSIIHSL